MLRGSCGPPLLVPIISRMEYDDCVIGERPGLCKSDESTLEEGHQDIIIIIIIMTMIMTMMIIITILLFYYYYWKSTSEHSSSRHYRAGALSADWRIG